MNQALKKRFRKYLYSACAICIASVLATGPAAAVQERAMDHSAEASSVSAQNDGATATITISLSAEAGLVYDGNAHPVTFVPPSGLEQGDYSLTYTGTGDTQYSSADAPVDAGSYRAQFALTEQGMAKFTLSDDSSLQSDFTIHPLDVSNLVVIEEVPALTYNGNVQIPTVTVTLDGTPLVQDKDFTVKATASDAGSAAAEIALKGNYTGRKFVNYTINKAAQTLSGTQSFDLTNDQQDTLLDIVSSAGPDAKITYRITEGQDVVRISGDGTLQPMRGGSAVILAKAEESDNYLASDELEIRVAVTAVPEIKWADVQYSDQGITVGATVKKGDLDVSSAVLEYQEKGAQNWTPIAPDTEQVDENTIRYTKTLAGLDPEKSYTLRMTVTDSSNHTVSQSMNFNGKQGGGVIILPDDSGNEEQVHFNIAVSSTVGGKVSQGSTSVAAGSDAVFLFTPDDGYIVKDILVDGESVGALTEYKFERVDADHTLEVVFAKAGDAVSESYVPYYLSNGMVVIPGFSAQIDGEMKYLAPEGTEVSFMDNHKDYTDVAGHWGADYIQFVSERELLIGTEDLTFSPDMGVTRAMFATVLGRLYESSFGPISAGTESAFHDLEQDAYYTKYVTWAAENHLVQGIGDGLFDPDRKITREEMAVMMRNLAEFMGKLPADTDVVLTYADADQISDWAKDGAAYCQVENLIIGREGNRLDPKETATRAEASAVIFRFVHSVLKA